MATRNYYVVLGIATNETPHGVRSAFRDLAKRYHPDRVGPDGAEAFREVNEAYGVLGDPARRVAYDESLRKGSSPTRRASVTRDFSELRPGRDAVLNRFAANFAPVAGPTAGGGVEALNLEVAISAEEAGRGARLLVGVPIFRHCESCAGEGCGTCRQQGLIERERSVSVDLPPMSGAGTTFVLPLTSFGVHNFYLRVRVRVEPTTAPPVSQSEV